MAVSVASGAPCLRHFQPAQTGRVLLFAAEDALHVVRRRLEGIAGAAGVDFSRLDVHVITTPTVRLDLARDRHLLRETVARLKPRLLVLDPFVRLHRVDENTASEVAPMLAYLRELERNLGTAVVLVHHARKGGHARAGQALRGSSELHAWGDSNLYLRRHEDRLLLSIEHRAAASRGGVVLELAGSGDVLALRTVETEVADPAPPAADPLDERVVRALAEAGAPLSGRELRDVCRVRNTALLETLATLCEAGRVVRLDNRYCLASA